MDVITSFKKIVDLGKTGLHSWFRLFFLFSSFPKNHGKMKVLTLEIWVLITLNIPCGWYMRYIHNLLRQHAQRRRGQEKKNICTSPEANERDDPRQCFFFWVSWTMFFLIGFCFGGVVIPLIFPNLPKRNPLGFPRNTPETRKDSPKSWALEITPESPK